MKALYLEAERLPQDARHASISPTAIAGRLEVSPSSATTMLKKLALLGLVSYAPYRGAALTERGGALALEIVRHHRLLETYLAEALGVPWDEIHDEAEVLEHVLSSDEHPDALRHLDDIGLLPGTTLKVAGRGPFEGPLFLEVDSREQAISKPMAEAIWVR